MSYRACVAGAFSALVALGVAACSSPTPADPQPSTLVVTSTLVTSASVPTAVHTVPAEPSPEASADRGFSEQPGTPAKFNGQAVTVCSSGDGWGISELAVNENTSCPFGFSVLDAMTEGVPSTENIRDYLPRSVEAHSPTTGQTYSMSCRDNGAGIITCTGGNNAEVILH